jgi:hypothetical protein
MRYVIFYTEYKHNGLNFERMYIIDQSTTEKSLYNELKILFKKRNFTWANSDNSFDKKKVMHSIARLAVDFSNNDTKMFYGSDFTEGSGEDYLFPDKFSFQIVNENFVVDLSQQSIARESFL